MARKTDRYDYAPDSYQPASNALGCPFTVAALGMIPVFTANTAKVIFYDTDTGWATMLCTLVVLSLTPGLAAELVATGSVPVATMMYGTKGG